MIRTTCIMRIVLLVFTVFLVFQLPPTDLKDQFCNSFSLIPSFCTPTVCAKQYLAYVDADAMVAVTIHTSAYCFGILYVFSLFWASIASCRWSRMLVLPLVLASGYVIATRAQSPLDSYVLQSLSAQDITVALRNYCDFDGVVETVREVCLAHPSTTAHDIFSTTFCTIVVLFVHCSFMIKLRPPHSVRTKQNLLTLMLIVDVIVVLVFAPATTTELFFGTDVMARKIQELVLFVILPVIFAVEATIMDARRNKLLREELPKQH